MSNNNNKPKLSEICIDEYIGIIVNSILLILFLWFVLWFTFCVYKPKEKNYVKQTRYAYSLIEKEAMNLFRTEGHVFDEEAIYDKLCQQLANKYSKRLKECRVTNGVAEPNIRFNKGGAVVYGLNSKPYKYGGTLVKDILIDINGDKGENQVGIDRTPVSIYSSGRLGGMLTPANCKAENVRKYGLRYSPLCGVGADVEFIDSKYPLSYNIIQIGGRKGQSRYISRNVSFLRADCSAFGSELLGMDDFCESRSYQWMTACYHEYYCAIELNIK